MFVTKAGAHICYTWLERFAKDKSTGLFALHASEEEEIFF
jgi:hypothetical protein